MTAGPILRAFGRAALPRFLLVGGGFALVNAVLAALLTGLLPWPASASAALAWILCIPPAWACQRHFTFREATPRRGGALLYLVTQALGLAISAGAGALFASGAFLRDMTVYLIASALAAGLSYVIARRVIFVEPPQ
ncbi:GtrA family protein [Pseudogemmobacter bohemicus]|uniref:GtrA family protein n=1 Tax=Pseudogemmobacter bohemicus TaxID=2250708 RepID=UPI000DD41D2F|nr:GtrA family protein [Pseudogemmobacter bohemicus]